MEMVYLNATKRGNILAHLRNFSVVSNIDYHRKLTILMYRKIIIIFQFETPCRKFKKK